VRQLGVGYRGVKNDQRDARVLSKASVALGLELPRVHVPCQTSRQLQRLLTQRQSLVQARTQLINGVKGQLRGELLSIRSGVSRTFAVRVRARLVEHPKLLMALEPMLQAVESVTASIKQLEEQLKEQTKDHPQVTRLMTMPGVGRLTATALVAAIDDLTRFRSAARLTSYLGLTPGENTTGGKQRLTRITKAGKGHVRMLLIQAAWTLTRVAPNCALAYSFQQLSERRPKQVAIVAIARKMARVVYAMLRDEKPYDPSAGKRSQEAKAAPQDKQCSAALRRAVMHTGQAGCIQT
jgi:transposase